MTKRAGSSFLPALDRHWLRLTLVAWAVIALWYIGQRWAAIQWLSLGDTDDNMRLMQVRALLDGQGWYDLRNYRLNPPAGFNIHWTRLVDLPIAALILILRPFLGTGEAERLACGIAPLLPLSLALVGLAATVRRLVAPLAWPLAIVFMLCSTVGLMMFMPDRIDHHGWQLAMLSLTVAGLCDPRGARGGAIVGIASAVSLTIGLEMLPYAVMAGAIIALRWVWQAESRDRLAAYALTLAGGSAAGFAAFASYDNRVPRCDALTPVWLSVMVMAGAFLLVLAMISPQRREVRLALAIAAGVVIAGAFALVFPQCLGRPEQVSDELYRNWLGNIREAKPIFKHPFRVGFPVAALPVMGLIGAGIATWRARRTPEALLGWACVSLFATFAAAMLLWQIRAGPAAQLLAVPGVAALAWITLPWLLGNRSVFVRVFGTVGGFVLISGLFSGLVLKWTPIDKPSPYVNRVNKASGRCVTLPAMQPLDRLPAQTVFTFVDLGPRLITLTHHSAIAGPYHRNGDAILDVQHAFTGSPEEARAIMKRHGATLLLVCPNMAESTIYRARAPGGFYSRLASNEKFPWLVPVPLPRNSPLRAFRIE
ncbi:AcrB/AcrD/AcrF family protein [uncultured Sphingomonas sp.]|uniref:AcrB/AcrD/AcrF family protein n=1 Tax=uncultured Sphingomonas sp. TaxID=158754 RepID=UPI002612B198|nr:AcrB/AcrD/AcrF family protein [uncultured Sphingomonas sp.]